MSRTIEVSITDMTTNSGDPNDPPEGITISDHRKRMGLDGNGLLTTSFIIELGAGIPFSILANWLYDRYFKAKPAASQKKITINKKTRVFIREGDLEMLFEEEVNTSEE